MFKKMLVPLDGSSLSEQVIPLAKELLEAGVEEATLFAVGETPRATSRRKGLRRSVPLAAVGGAFPHGMISATPPEYAETKDQAIAREEQELLTYLHNAGHHLVETARPVHAAVHFGEPAQEIIDFAKKDGVDLIVMATHGRSGLRETLQGSVTATVIRSGVAPVLVLRPKKRTKADNTSTPVGVLLIDSHDDARATLAKRLRRDRRLELVGATASLSEAADLLASSDIVLLDVHEREGRGVDACRAIRKLTHAPVVTLTSFMTPELWAEVKEAGAVDYLLKHVDTDQLGSELVRLAKGRPAGLAGRRR